MKNPITDDEKPIREAPRDRQAARSRCTALALAVALAASGLAAPAGGEWQPGVRAGIYGGWDAFIGFDLLRRVERRWSFNPSLEWVFVDRGDLFSLNADVHYDLETEAEVDLWAGGGLALLFRDRDRRGSETDGGLNLLAGAGFRRIGAVRPYVQGKIVLSEDSEGVLAFGVRF